MNKDARISILLDLYGKILSKTQFTCMDLYYNQDFSLSEISLHMKISRQGVFDSIKRAQTILEKMETSICLFEKISKIDSCLKKISDLACEIKNDISVHEFSAAEKKTETIEKLASGLSYKI